VSADWPVSKIRYTPPEIRKDDPEVRKDGKCQVCKGERPEVAVKNFDPFCSATCSRKYHKVGE
jgi:hypothetical protein